MQNYIKYLCCDCIHGEFCGDYNENENCIYRKADGSCWESYAKKEIEDLKDNILLKVQQLREEGKEIYPSQENIFKAFEYTPIEKTKVVIIGQDPYPSPNKAMGLSFSIPKGEKITLSLKNIFKELTEDLNIPYPSSGDLTAWANEGVLLLNTVLTVEKGKPNSHRYLKWEEYTKYKVEELLNYPSGMVFILWGRQAYSFFKKCEHACENINGKLKKVIYSAHPSPLSSTKKTKYIPAFKGSRPFSQANKLLSDMGISPIDWRLS